MNNRFDGVVIDPGHGGLDGGASKNGYKETDFTMKLATKLKNKLEEYGCRKVIIATNSTSKEVITIYQMTSNENCMEFWMKKRKN